MPLLSNYPELERVPTGAERREIRWAAFRRSGNSPTVLLAALLPGATIILLLSPLRSALADYMPVGGSYLPELVAACLAAVLGSYIAAPIDSRAKHRAVRAEMASRGYPICVECGYNLTGLELPRCPECGQPFARLT